MKKLNIKEPFLLESGDTLSDLTIGYTTYGNYDPEKNNVVWVCHALTGNPQVFEWWEGLFGDNQLFNPEDYFIVCVNALGSCYGTTGPSTPTGNRRPLLEYFPFFTIRDIAGVNEVVREFLGIERISLLVGASLGGQVALEWSIEQPELFDKLALIATNARHSAYGIAFNESQRLAILADPTFGNGQLDGGRAGLIAARSIAMLSYRTYECYNLTQTNPGDHKTERFLASSYQQYQGQKLADRFDAYSYFRLTEAMDSHNVGRNRISLKSALRRIKSETLVIGIRSDVLFPVEEQQFLAEVIPCANLVEIESVYGHDGFLTETDQLTDIFNDFLSNDLKNFKPTTLKSRVIEELIIE